MEFDFECVDCDHVFKGVFDDDLGYLIDHVEKCPKCKGDSYITHESLVALKDALRSASF